MFLDWIVEQFTQGYQSKITKPSHYQSAARYLRAEMQQLVAHSCPDEAKHTLLHRKLEELTTSLQKLQDSYFLLEHSYQKQQVQSNALTRQSQEIEMEKKQLLGMQQKLHRDVTHLEIQLQIPGDATYEETQEQLQAWLAEAEQAETRLSALKTLADRRYFPHLEEALIDCKDRNRELEQRFIQQGQHAQKLQTQLKELAETISHSLNELSRVQELHRKFLQKDAQVQKQFQILDQQIPPLLQNKEMEKDWYDLVQSWYKANNLANSTIKSVSRKYPRYRELNTRCEQVLRTMDSLQKKLALSGTASLETGLERELTDFWTMQKSLALELRREREFLQNLKLRTEAIKETAKKRALQELEQVQVQWELFTNLCREYVSRKTAASYRPAFQELSDIHQRPYCLRTIHHSPVPPVLTQVTDYSQFISLCNRDFINRRLEELDDYFSNLLGKNLTEAQRIALLTDEDYVQVMGEDGYGKTFVTQAKVTYLQEQLGAAPERILLLRGREAFTYVGLKLLNSISEAPLQIANVGTSQDYLNKYLPEDSDGALLLQCLELAKCVNALPKEGENSLVSQLTDLVQTYQDHLQEQHLVDKYDLLRQAALLLERGTVGIPYDYLIIDDFQEMSPLDFDLLKAMLKSSPHTKLFCTGTKWQCLTLSAYIEKSFPLLPRHHFLVQGLLAEAEAPWKSTDTQGSYLSLTETRGEVILLTPLPIE